MQIYTVCIFLFLFKINIHLARFRKKKNLQESADKSHGYAQASDLSQQKEKIGFVLKSLRAGGTQM